MTSDFICDIDSDGHPIVWVAEDRTDYKYPYEEICFRKEIAEKLIKLWKKNYGWGVPPKDEDYSIRQQKVTLGNEPKFTKVIKKRHKLI